MLKNKIANMTNRQLAAAVGTELAKTVAVAVAAGVAFHLAVRLIAGPVAKDSNND
jgi:hypothetical protein